MRFREPKDTKRILWTKHVKEKMRFYNLSEGRLKSLLRNPEREEKGIAPGTVAIMRSAKSKKRPSEIWLMYQTIKVKDKERKIKIISAWRYPGESPIGELPIPEEIIRDLVAQLSDNNESPELPSSLE